MVLLDLVWCCWILYGVAGSCMVLDLFWFGSFMCRSCIVILHCSTNLLASNLDSRIPLLLQGSEMARDTVGQSIYVGKK
jgi:hypothetical protein